MLLRAGGANAIQQHGMAFKHKTVVFGDFMLTLFDFVVGEFDDCAAIGANKVVVVIAVVKFKDRLASIKQIGRASCRERVCQYVSISVVAVTLKKKKTLNNIKQNNKIK